MQILFTLLTCVLLAGNLPTTTAAEGTNDWAWEASAEEGLEINWMTDYEAAVRKADDEGKPILLFFTGSDWCGWCMKLVSEVLSQPEFIESMHDRFVFVEVDFPKRTALPNDISEQNERLAQLYGIRSYPTIIILDDQLNQVVRTGYRPGGSAKFAEHLTEQLRTSNRLTREVNTSQLETLPTNELVKLYNQARSTQRTETQKAVLTVGLKKEDNLFFLCEAYRLTANSRGLEDMETAKIRNAIISKDPENLAGAQRLIAIVDFQNLSKNYVSGGDTQAVIQPLVSYVDNFGVLDPVQTWKVQMAITQFLYNQGEMETAMTHAEAAQKIAPADFQGEISQAIDKIRQDIR